MHHAERETVGPLKCFEYHTLFHVILAANSRKIVLIIGQLCYATDIKLYS